MAKHPEDARNEEMDTKVQTVVEILEAQGHCPVTKLIEASKSQDLSPQHQAAVNRWLMEHAYAKPTSIKHEGNVGVRVTKVERVIVDPTNTDG